MIHHLSENIFIAATAKFTGRRFRKVLRPPPPRPPRSLKGQGRGGRVAMTQSPTQYDELLAAAEVASHALHQFHPQEHRIPVGRGICTWKPCQALFNAIAKAKASPQAQ